MVARALSNLPGEFRRRMDNIDVVVQDYPTSRQLAQVRLNHPMSLLGLYQGVPLTRRGGNYNMVLPDKVTIFQKPIERMCHSDEEIVREVRRVVIHEIAHHFGISDADLERLEGGRE